MDTEANTQTNTESIDGKGSDSNTSRMAICPNCGSAFVYCLDEESDYIVCTKCGSECVRTNYTQAEWDARKPKDRKSITDAVAASPLPASKWVTFVHVLCNFILVLGPLWSVIKGLMLISADRDGITVMLVGTLVSFVSVSGIKVMLEVAADIRVIRNRLTGRF